MSSTALASENEARGLRASVIVSLAVGSFSGRSEQSPDSKLLLAGTCIKSIKLSRWRNFVGYVLVASPTMLDKLLLRLLDHQNRPLAWRS